MPRLVLPLLAGLALSWGCRPGTPEGIATPASAGLPAGDPISIGTHLTLRSETLQEDRSVLVYLPESYAGSTFRYPVLYLLDGTSDFLHTVGIVQFLAGIDRIPELILVGVANTNRSRDLTPPSANVNETAFWDEVGGADRFLRFLREELIPLIDQSYRTQPYRILRGQSFGGLLAIHDYMSGAPTFDAYLTSSAAVGWNYGELIARAPDFFAGAAIAPLYLSAGGRDHPDVVKSVREFADVLERHGSPDLRWRYELFEDEGHYSLVQLSTHNSLRFLYADWQVADSLAAAADFAAYERHYVELSRLYGYEVMIPMQSVIRLGNRLLRAGRFAEGIAVLENNLDLYPQQPESYWHVGDAFVLSGQPEEARPYFEVALEKAVALDVPDVEHYRRSLD